MIHDARAGAPTRFSARSRISPAALFVNVIARISGGFTPTAARRCAIRCVRTRVLPEPAPAITSTGPSVVSTASRCAGLRSWRYVSGVVAAIRRAYLRFRRMRAGRGRQPQTDMSAEDAAAILDRLGAAGLTAWVDGGWAVDALAGRQTRTHDDLDLVVLLDEVPAVERE